MKFTASKAKKLVAKRLNLENIKIELDDEVKEYLSKKSPEELKALVKQADDAKEYLKQLTEIAKENPNRTLKDLWRTEIDLEFKHHQIFWDEILKSSKNINKDKQIADGIIDLMIAFNNEAIDEFGTDNYKYYSKKLKSLKAFLNLYNIGTNSNSQIVKAHQPNPYPEIFKGETDEVFQFFEELRKRLLDATKPYAAYSFIYDKMKKKLLAIKHQPTYINFITSNYGFKFKSHQLKTAISDRNNKIFESCLDSFPSIKSMLL